MTALPPRTILIVDDSVDDRATIRRYLARHDREYTMLEAATGAEGLGLARANRIDCLILDYSLPDMDGHQVLDGLRREGERLLPTPVVMLTGHEDDAMAFDALEKGAQDYLVKDALTPRSLARAIENSMAKFRVQRELFESQAAVELRNHKLEMLQDELKQKLTELASATHTKDQFMAVMSHEMRTPLNAIIGYAELLEMEIHGSLTEEQRQQVDRIRVGGRHLLDLINDLLDLARADANKLELDLRPVDLQAVLEEVTALLEREAQAKRLRLTLEGCDRPILVQADLQRIRQIFVNLVGNAIKFTEEGSVSVRCGPGAADGTVSVEVTDTGIGIDPEVIPLVFNEFYQAKGDLTRKHGGSGLGLAIAQRMAKLMGGQITVESRLGEGTTFTMMLRTADRGSGIDRSDDADLASRSGQRGRSDRTGSGSPDVVVGFSDDAEALAELARQLLPRIRLVWSTDPNEISALTRRESPVLVVLDISSAGGSAWRAAMSLQEIAETASSAVFLIPSLPPHGSGDGALKGDPGWLSMISKPFTGDQLSDAVSVAVAGVRDAEAGRGRPYRVLVVDDDMDSRRVAATFLKDFQLEVVEAPDGETGLVAMRVQRPDVVVLDLMMPVLDGFGVLAAMRADPSLATIPVVVLTAKDLTEGERQFLARTAMRVLQKGEHRLTDVAALVLRAAERAPLQRASAD